jgi:methyl-accepting chemotaxis protein
MLALLGSVAGALALSTLLTALEYRAALRQRGLGNLLQVLTLQKQAYETYLEDLREATMVAGHDGRVERELPQLISAFNGLSASGDRTALQALVQRQLIGPLSQRADRLYGGLEAASLLPQSPQGLALQQQYIAGANRPHSELLRWGGPGVNAYDRLYASLHEELYPMLHAFGLYDIFLVSPSGDVVFSLAKEFDLGTNLLSGPYAASGLGQVVQALRQSAPQRLAAEQAAVEELIEVSTMEPYLPSLGAPSIFTGAPVYLNGSLQGYLCTQVDISAFIKTLTGNFQWQAMGLGETGDLLLLDRKGTRISMPRLTHSQREKALDQLARHGAVSEERLAVLRQMEHASGLLQEQGPAVESVLAGKSGEGVRRNLFGDQVLVAWTPVPDPSKPDGGQSWGLLAEQSLSELYAPLRRLLINASLNASLALMASAALGLWLSRRLTGPLLRVQTLTRQLINHGVHSLDARAVPAQLRAVAAVTATEVGVLADDLATLQDDLFSSFDSLQATNATVESLSTPISTISAGVLLLPLIGSLDYSRAQRVRDAALNRIVEEHARFFIWDLAGLVDVEGGMAPFLSSICQAVQLLGCRSVLSGVTPRLAGKLSADGLTLGQVLSTASLQDALAQAQAGLLRETTTL